MKKTTKLINKSILSGAEMLTYLTENKKFNKHIEYLLFAENNELFFFRDNILSYQNTNIENYPALLKSFIKDVNKSAELLIKALIEVKNDDFLSKILVENLMLIGHEIEICVERNMVPVMSDSNIVTVFEKEVGEELEKKVVYSKTVKNKYNNYFRFIHGNYKILLDFFQVLHDENILLKDISLKMLADNVQILKKAMSGMDGTSHDIYVRDRLYHTLVAINKHPLPEHALFYFSDVELSEFKKAIEFLWKKKSIFYNMSYSVNLQDEKIIDKKDCVFLLDEDGFVEEFVAKGAGTMLAKRHTISFKWDVDFSMSYYLKKEIFELSTQRAFKEGMSTVKDFLSRDKYAIDISSGKNNYVKTHPFNIQSSANVNFFSSLNKLRAAYLSALKVVEQMNIEQSYEKWAEIVFDTKIFHGYKSEYLGVVVNKEVIKKELRAAAKEMGLKIFDRSSLASDGEAFLKTVNESYYIHELIMGVLDYTYSDIKIDIDEKLRENIKYQDRATFHTTLKDSYVVDTRNAVAVSENTKKLLESEPLFELVLSLIEKHPYHNYIEIDREAFLKNSEIDIRFIIDFLEHTGKLRLPCKYKCNLKFRKLGNYKANGIYFSHTKTVGVDYRHGRGSYIHEMAHHIDLNNFFEFRKKMVSILFNYFRGRIRDRAEYFLKDEELIARGAEIGLLLIESKYNELIKQKHESFESFLEKMKSNFQNSPYSMVMKDWNVYLDSNEYIEVGTLLKGKDFYLLNTVFEYYSVFWDSGYADTSLLLSANADYSPKESIYPNSHHSYDYYHCKEYDIRHNDVDGRKFLEIIMSYL